jgi:hypothetical protein
VRQIRITIRIVADEYQAEKGRSLKLHPAFLLFRPLPSKNQPNAVATKCFLNQYLFMPRWSSIQVLICTIFLAGLLLPVSSSAGGRGFQAESKIPAADAVTTPPRPIVVELFTSEGCSSCPPADALLEKLDSTQPVPGVQLIVLSEHVDYWDHDGWKDPNSSPAFTERQQDYVRALKLQTPYTPQLIVDGFSEVHANDPQEVDKVFQEAVATPKIQVRIGDVTVDAGSPAVIRTRVEADGGGATHNAEVYVAVALSRVESQVLHGENGGHHLTHVAVVTQIARIGKLQKGKDFSEAVALKLKPGTDPKNVRLIAFVQESGPGKVLGAALRKLTI